MDKFPSLLKHSRREEQEPEKEIIQWIDKKVDQDLQLILLNKIEEFKANSTLSSNCENQFEERFNEEKKKVQKEFSELYDDKLSHSFLIEMQNILSSHLVRVKTNLFNELNSYIHKIKIKTYNIQGVEAIRDTALRIKKSPQLSQ